MTHLKTHTHTHTLCRGSVLTLGVYWSRVFVVYTLLEILSLFRVCVCVCVCTSFIHSLLRNRSSRAPSMKRKFVCTVKFIVICGFRGLSSPPPPPVSETSVVCIPTWQMEGKGLRYFFCFRTLKRKTPFGVNATRVGFFYLLIIFFPSMFEQSGRVCFWRMTRRDTAVIMKRLFGTGQRKRRFIKTRLLLRSPLLCLNKIRITALCWSHISPIITYARRSLFNGWWRFHSHIYIYIYTYIHT